MTPVLPDMARDIESNYDEFELRDVANGDDRDRANRRRQLELQLTQLMSVERPGTEEQQRQLLHDIRKVKEQSTDLTL